MKYRAINIRPCLNGFVVDVGCQTLVFVSLEDVGNTIVRYAKDPEGIEKMYLQETYVKIEGPRLEPESDRNRMPGEESIPTIPTVLGRR